MASGVTVKPGIAVDELLRLFGAGYSCPVERITLKPQAWFIHLWVPGVLNNGPS